MLLRPALHLTLASLGLTAVSCGVPVAPVAQESTSIGDTLPAVDELVTSPAVVDGPLSIDDALLVATDAPAPWEHTHREVDRYTHDIGPNQTDCSPYWEYERLGRLHGGETMWWRDGGNLNQMVRREGEPGQAARLIDVFANLSNTCAETSWSEGDSFTIEPLDLRGVDGLEGVVALSIDHVRTDEVVWLAFAQRGDLISELRVTMWPEFETGRIPSFSPADFGTVAAKMADRLAAAGPGEVAPPTTTPPSTIPGERPDDPPSPTLPRVPPELETPPIETLPPITLPQDTLPPISLPPTTLAPLDDMASALLTTDELPDGWSASRGGEYDHGGGDEPLNGCPESAAIVDVDQHFEFSADLNDENAGDWRSFGIQLIGRLPSDLDSLAFVESFVAVDGCEGIEDDLAYRLSATTVSVDGADAAAIVIVEQTGTDDTGDDESQQFVLALATAGPTLTAFSLSSDAPALDLLQRAVTKVVESELG